MAAKAITVYIDPSQLSAQKENNYSLFLAKKVNDQFTVIWQAMGPVATVSAPSYEYENTFQVATPSYQVNYGEIDTSEGSVAFTAAGMAQNIEPGQTVVLDQNGIFGVPTNGGVAGAITINNALQGNPSAALYDQAGNPIFVNVRSGMDIGQAMFAPVDTYQLWFDNYQQTGTIIAFNASNSVMVTFGGETNLVVSYNAEGEWRAGPLATPAQVEGQAVGGQASAHPFALVVNFDRSLDGRAKEYVKGRFHRDFPSERRPKHHVLMGDAQLWLYFDGGAEIDGPAALAAADATLTRAKADPTSGLERQTWTLHQTQ